MEINREGIHEIRNLGLSSVNLTFSMPAYPYLIFKTDRFTIKEPQVAQHYANMLKAVEVCHAHKLNRLVVPHAKKVQLSLSKNRTIELIACERLQFSEKNQKRPSTETTRQLALFIAKTGLSHAAGDELPLLENGKIGLISLSMLL